MLKNFFAWIENQTCAAILRGFSKAAVTLDEGAENNKLDQLVIVDETKPVKGRGRNRG